MSKGTIILLLSLLLVSIKISPYFKLKNLTNLKQLESVKLFFNIQLNFNNFNQKKIIIFKKIT